MSRITTATPPLTPTSLIDEVMGVLARGEAALFADLAQAAWQPQATLASLAGSGCQAQNAAAQRDAA
jgi:hypothetical protein